jgi:hypothetical protein
MKAMLRCKLYNGLMQNLLPACTEIKSGVLNPGPSLPMLYGRSRTLYVGSSGMEFAAVPLPPFGSRSTSGHRKRCEDFISTIYSTTPATMTAIHSSRADDDMAERRILLRTAATLAAGDALWNGRKEIHDGKD